MIWFQVAVPTLSKATPLLLAAMGGLVSELSGVINFALEGMMLMGAFGAVWVAFATGSPWLGLAGGVGGGILIAILHSLATLKFRADQIVSSVALNLLSAGLSGLLLNQVFKVYGTSPSVAKLPGVLECMSMILPHSWQWSDLRWQHLSILVPIALSLGGLLMGFLHWSVWGLRVKACGETPMAARSVGLGVGNIRFWALCCSGALAGMGGAYLAIGELSQFVERITQGRGYLAIAALILGRWRPGGVLLATLFFGFGEASSEWLAMRWSSVPSQLSLAFPYLLGLIVLCFYRGKRNPPSSLGKL